jgi:proton glutamate symport protein
VQFKLPLEGAAILLAIDQILDMGRTSVNVMGNCIATRLSRAGKACSTTPR